MKVGDIDFSLRVIIVPCSIQWKRFFFIYISVYIFLLAVIWCAGHNLIPEKYAFCPNNEAPEFDIQEYNLIYKIFSGVAIVAFCVDFSKVISHEETHEHANALRILLLLGQFTTIITDLTMAYPEITLSIFGINSCDKLGGKTIFQVIDRFVTVPVMFYITICIDCLKTELNITDCIIIFGGIVNGVTMNLSIFGNIPMYISNYYNNIGWYYYNFSCALLLWNCYWSYQKVMGTHGVSLSDIFIKQAAYEQLTGASFVCAVLHIVAIFRLFFPPLASLTSFVVVFVLSMLLKLLYPVFTLSGYDDQLSREAVLLQQAKIMCDLERKYLKRNLHEIREPLNVITIGHPYLQELIKNSSKREGADLKDINEYLSIVKYASSYMSKTLHATLSGELMEREVNVASLLESVYMCQKVDAENKGITLHTTIDSNVPSVIVCDEDRIEHVLMNLLNNAIKFSDTGANIYIKVSKHVDFQDFVTFSVRDEGLGMTEENVNNLFTPFLQFHSDRIQGGKGTGVGLSMCREMVLLHKGDIKCRSRRRPSEFSLMQQVDAEDQTPYGSEFYFYLPTKRISDKNQTSNASMSIPDQFRSLHNTNGVLSSSGVKVHRALIVDGR